MEGENYKTSGEEFKGFRDIVILQMVHRNITNGCRKARNLSL